MRFIRSAFLKRWGLHLHRSSQLLKLRHLLLHQIEDVVMGRRAGSGHVAFAFAELATRSTIVAVTIVRLAIAVWPIAPWLTL